MNDQLVSAAETTAVLLSGELPDVSCLELIPNRADAGARLRVQLSASTTELTHLLRFADQLDGDVSAAVLRRVAPFEFTQVEVCGQADDVDVTAWSHLGFRELAALRSVVGTLPERNLRVPVELESLRAAADALEPGLTEFRQSNSITRDKGACRELRRTYAR